MARLRVHGFFSLKCHDTSQSETFNKANLKVAFFFCKGGNYIYISDRKRK